MVVNFCDSRHNIFLSDPTHQFFCLKTKFVPYGVETGEVMAKVIHTSERRWVLQYPQISPGQDLETRHSYIIIHFLHLQLLEFSILSPRVIKILKDLRKIAKNLYWNLIGINFDDNLMITISVLVRKISPNQWNNAYGNYA